MITATPRKAAGAPSVSISTPHSAVAAAMPIDWPPNIMPLPRARSSSLMMSTASPSTATSWKVVARFTAKPIAPRTATSRAEGSINAAIARAAIISACAPRIQARRRPMARKL